MKDSDTIFEVGDEVVLYHPIFAPRDSFYPPLTKIPAGTRGRISRVHSVNGPGVTVRFYGWFPDKHIKYGYAYVRHLNVLEMMADV